MKPFRYVQSFVDRKTGAVFHYFRRRGYPRVRLPGLPGSREFLETYQRALDSQQMPIGAARTKAGTVNAAIIGYYDSTMFFGSLAPSTQAIRRQILESFRADHGDKPIAQMPQKFIVLTLGKLRPSVAIGWLTTIRHLMEYAVSANLCEADPTQGIKLKTPKSNGIYLDRAGYCRLRSRTWCRHEGSIGARARPLHLSASQRCPSYGSATYPRRDSLG